MRRLLLCACVLAAVLAGGCRAASTPALRPAAVVTRLLELRASGSRDASAYAELLDPPPVASALASGPLPAKGHSLIPHWETPVETRVGTSTADVLVRWRKSAGFPIWAPATRFVLQWSGSGWFVTDAIPLLASEVPTR